ncbi:hypothetical protein DFJ74DRAFT_775145 [Hyaloraphidium curvatum]|nr:hypothetical protein DFJ74DRAFT_775145 [Hyaloraphidium curvatum]
MDPYFPRKALNSASIEEHSEEHGAPPPLFPARVWLALLPFPASPPRPFAAPQLADPASSLRSALPLTPAQFVAAARPWPLLVFLVRTSGFLAPGLAILAFLILAAAVFTVLATILPAWLLDGDDVFRTPQLAAGTAALIFSFVCHNLFLRYLAGVKLLYKPTKEDMQALLNTSPLAQLVRWSQLVEEGQSDTAISKFLQHDPADECCPCAARSCAGAVPARFAAGKLLTDGTLCCIWMAQAMPGFLWTPLVTLRSAVAQSPWAIFFVVGSLLSIVAMSLVASASFVRPMVGLSLRLNHRATQLALEDTVSMLRAAALGDGDLCVHKVPGERQPYVVMDILISSSWKQRYDVSKLQRAYMMSFFTYLAGAVVNAIAGSCVPVAYIIVLAAILGVLFSHLLTAAASNSEMSAISALHSQAASELEELLSWDIPAEVRGRIAGHASVLRGFAAAAGVEKAKLAGVPVDYGVARTTFATAVTVCLGLWTLLRGVGVGISMDVACQ